MPLKIFHALARIPLPQSLKLLIDRVLQLFCLIAAIVIEGDGPLNELCHQLPLFDS